MTDLGGATPRTLILVRHARAGAVAASDHERTLTPDGLAAARELGVWLAGRGTAPDAALVSGAERTRQTWAQLAEGAGWSCPVDFSEPLYAAGSDTALDLLRDLDPDARTAVVVGHNPTIALLASLLDDGEGDLTASLALTVGGFPPGAAAVLEIPGGWRDLRESYGALVAYHVGGAPD